MDKIYLLIVGEKVRAFASLKKLSEEIGARVEKKRPAIGKRQA
jgi:hypothetical protein